MDCCTGLLDWIAGLDCWTDWVMDWIVDWIAGLDCWTELLDWIVDWIVDWIAGLDCWIGLTDWTVEWQIIEKSHAHKMVDRAHSSSCS